MSIKIIPSLLLFAYYWMSVRRYFKPVYTIIQSILILCILVILLIIRGKRDVFDEFAKKTLYKTNSICFKIAYIIMVGVLFPSAVVNSNTIIMGYLIVGGIVVLTIAQAVIFCIIDRRGI
ncbi:hypothetical protein [Clostridium estertheticum]|uniref:DUF2178 domain-containing protein n=1 Tax=Clostridium estertheticum TaxID=238834 RepID=A0A7Y3T0K9_9CLOT|nr:hypothetical protein [Clostridium estertheticum]MBX4267211.1 hypothetical protein [Clostridium estertheticum]MCB2342881.1 hypothetical protein [Clostridium estertheticum]NNU78505.1 hypothetical protein [Clostridium estertheticum]WBL49635.1 hypothetical protein LOR37_22960 [Clostridium estertheticum]WLC91204.1 hypothetical protein KTC95_23710 [Clostridium estertheticum]